MAKRAIDNLESTGGQGVCAHLSEPGHVREGLKMLRRAVSAGWPIPDDERPAIVNRLLSLAKSSDDERVAVAAAKVLQAMAKDNIDAATALDRVERLEGGQPTDNVAVYQVIIPGAKPLD